MKCLSQEQNRMTRSRHKPGSLDLLIRTRLLILHKDLNIIRLVAIIKRSLFNSKYDAIFWRESH